MKKSYLELNTNEIDSLLTVLGESSFRAEQIHNWIYNHGVVSWGEMENLPQSLRDNLENMIPLHPLRIIKISGSDSKSTRKYLFETFFLCIVLDVLCYLVFLRKGILAQKGKRGTLIIYTKIA